MRIAILTYGSRGDIQPFIPLSRGLMARGHSVKLVAPARFTSLVEEHGIELVPLAGDPAELSRHLNNSGRNVVKTVQGLMRHAVEIGADVLRQAETACDDADLIIHTFMHAVGGHSLAREKNIPDIHIQLFPMYTPTGDYPNISLPDLRIRFLNRWTHELSHRIAVWTSKAGYEQVRRNGRLPRRKLYSPFDNDPRGPRTPVLCAWSPHVLPPSSDWTSNVHVIGYLFGDHDVAYQPAANLQKFIEGGDAPVCVSFGSMMNREAEKIDSIIRDALKRTKQRGIILTGWSQLSSQSSNELLYLDAAPHQWLLPRCKMIIHHGGAGTTSAGLRAGIPNVVVPFAADQPFWGSRVYAIGAGPKPIPVKKVSVENLIQAMVEANTDATHKCTQAVGQKLRNEDGVGKAIELIEKYSDEFQRVQ